MKNLSLNFLLLFLLFTTSLSAQKYKKTESNNIRIDPEWSVTNDLNGFSMSGQMIVDKEGNTFSIGYFRRDMNANGKWLGPKCNQEHPRKCQESLVSDETRR